MVNFIITWLIAAVSLAITANIVPGIAVTNFTSALFASLIIGFVNATVRPILTLLTLPLTILSLGLFLLVVNAVSFSLAAWLSQIFNIGFQVSGFWAPLFGAVVLSIISSLIASFVKPRSLAD